MQSLGKFTRQRAPRKAGFGSALTEPAGKVHDDGQVLRDLTDVVYPLFKKQADLAQQEVSKTTDPPLKEQWEKLRVKYVKVANSLLDSNYRRSVIKEFAPLVEDCKFEEKLDSNVNLLGFEDCVYDLAAGEARPGRPEDCLTKSVGYPYPRESRGCEADIEDFLCKILPDPELRNYLLDLLAQKLCGACVKRVCIHTGLGGDNGKTTLFEFLLEAMGEYGVKAKVQMFTRERLDASRADPEMARFVGIRLLFAEEPDDGARWNIQFVKELSGGGIILFRLNFGNVIHTAPAQFMMHFACNSMIEVNGSDGGFRNRLNKIDYRSRFVDGDSQVNAAALSVQERHQHQGALFRVGPGPHAYAASAIQAWVRASSPCQCGE